MCLFALLARLPLPSYAKARDVVIVDYAGVDSDTAGLAAHALTLTRPDGMTDCQLPIVCPPP
ncbi:hypothetical protein [Candidatus Sodalis sp. SoCistrobi]|uniref:hypothetical protein n=1 Tax=Candidatus Sodalis sp. SoCistrobi TaxID=1922216 RepID=UPI000F7A7FBD|nr:hypothetical protein [Candidatus Sodalis sp. SoCistrobi]